MTHLLNCSLLLYKTERKRRGEGFMLFERFLIQEGSGKKDGNGSLLSVNMKLQVLGCHARRSLPADAVRACPRPCDQVTSDDPHSL